MSSNCSSKCSDCQTRKHRTIKSCCVVSANRPSPDPTLIFYSPVFWKDNQVQVISLHLANPLRNSPSCRTSMLGCGANPLPVANEGLGILYHPDFPKTCMYIRILYEFGDCYAPGQGRIPKESATCFWDWTYRMGWPSGQKRKGS